MEETVKAFGDYKVRIVWNGEKYGPDNSLTNDGPPLIEFFYAGFRFKDDGRKGRFERRYELETLMGAADDWLRGGLWLVEGDIKSLIPDFYTAQIANWLIWTIGLGFYIFSFPLQGSIISLTKECPTQKTAIEAAVEYGKERNLKYFTVCKVINIFSSGDIIPVYYGHVDDGELSKEEFTARTAGS